VLRTRLTDERIGGEVFIHDGAIDGICLTCLSVRKSKCGRATRSCSVTRTAISSAKWRLEPPDAQRGRGRRHGLQLSRLTAADLFDLCQRLPALRSPDPSGGPTAELDRAPMC